MEFKRLELIIGNKNIEKLKNSHIAIFGLGGVGGYVAEGLSRSGIGQFTLIDYDIVDITNINRQIIATHSSIGKYKTELFEKRIKDISPDAKIKLLTKKYEKSENELFFGEEHYDFVVDAIDMVTSKIDLIVSCYEKNIPIISSMGMGKRLDPSHIRLTTLDKTYNCGLAKVMRRELKAYGITKLPCVFSDEICEFALADKVTEKKGIGSSAFVPSVAGFTIASYIIRNLIGEENEK